ncbi:uncharacterized protein LY89DRAFT_778962 [Mollisia scopiformis]|uniref:Transmembrane protein n=1 Tax=Mollisia scopiformis TaxID=149040 RepID=A0A194XMS8_MOLSC|nr:uncharacterized protein LY89DRAFT_778962 [Mollisia scopiformis]KUJ21431.1 hypothetical protein LY89DRAFT_778962 [Mollisia scopiformis]
MQISPIADQGSPTLSSTITALATTEQVNSPSTEITSARNDFQRQEDHGKGAAREQCSQSIGNSGTDLDVGPTDTSRHVASQEANHKIRPSREDDGQIAHRAAHPQEGNDPVLASGIHSIVTEQDYGSIIPPPTVDVSNSEVHQLLRDARASYPPPGQQRSLRQIFHPIPIPLASLLFLSFFVPVGAAPLADSHGHSRSTTVLLPAVAIETFVLISSAVSFLCLVKRFIQGCDGLGSSTVPLWIVLISVMPMSLSVFADVGLGLSGLVYAMILVTLVLILSAILLYKTILGVLTLARVRQGDAHLPLPVEVASVEDDRWSRQIAILGGCPHCRGEGCSKCGNGGSSGGDPRSTSQA